MCQACLIAFDRHQSSLIEPQRSSTSEDEAGKQPINLSDKIDQQHVSPADADPHHKRSSSNMALTLAGSSRKPLGQGSRGSW